MTDFTDLESLEQKRLCYGCVGEKYLTDEIRSKGKHGQCSYCGKLKNCYTIGEMAKRIDEVFGEHYRRTADQPDDWQTAMLADNESNYIWVRDGEPVVDAIMNAAEIPEAAAQDIQEVVDGEYSDFEAGKLGEETEFSSDTYYEEKGASDANWQEAWQSFEQSLKTQARFFSAIAAKYLSSIFDGIESMQTRGGRPLVVEAGPGMTLDSLYRARAFQSDDNLKAALCRPDQHLGSPPSSLARAGRMNAHGISVFYGANDPRVALAEIRPPVGSQVAVARFEITRPIKLLDLTALSDVSSGGSIFDPSFAARLERDMFLRSLSKRITRPIMPDDEAFEYLSTQAIADFLATEAGVPLDGIIFPSVQFGGDALNVVLFHKASGVEGLEIPAGTEISSRLGEEDEEEGWVTEYTVIEEVPVKEEEPSAQSLVGTARPNLSRLAAIPWEPVDGDWADWRPTTLRFVTDSLKIHIVRKVEFSSEEHQVYRHRWANRKLPF